MTTSLPGIIWAPLNRYIVHD